MSASGVKASVSTRVLAKLVDIFLVLVLAALPLYPVGPLLGFAYSLVADGLKLPLPAKLLGPGRSSIQGQSVGKWLFRLRVVMTVSRNVGEPGSGSMAEGETLKAVREPASVRASVLRNAPVGVATFFAIIPLWGWIILGIVGVPLMIMEIYLMATVETGHRLGDVMGDTEVVHV